MSVNRVGVLGAGSWGTVMAAVLADAGREVTMFARRPEVVDEINIDGTNKSYVPGLRFRGKVSATADPAEAAHNAEFVFLAVTAQTLRSCLTEWAPVIEEKTTYVSLIKGIELGSLKLMSQLIADVADVPRNRVAVLSGPNIAPEIVERQPTGTVVSCNDGATSIRLQETCRTDYFRPYTSIDSLGCEIGGAVKNVVAVAVGIAAGLGLGENATAALITRGLAETTRLGIAMGCSPSTLAGLAGAGDMIATCTSPASRNRRFGVDLGRGMSVQEGLTDVGQTVEGNTSAMAVFELAQKYHVEMPIVSTVVEVLEGRLTPSAGVSELMSRTVKPEYRR